MSHPAPGLSNGCLLAGESMSLCCASTRVICSSNNSLPAPCCSQTKVGLFCLEPEALFLYCCYVHIKSRSWINDVCFEMVLNVSFFKELSGFGAGVG